MGVTVISTPLVPGCHTTSGCGGFAAGSGGKGQQSPARCPKAAPGTSVTDDRGWTGHWSPATLAGCPGSAPTGSQGWRGGTQSGKCLQELTRFSQLMCTCGFFQGEIRTGQRQILLWSSVLCRFAAVFISPGQSQMVNTL